MPVLIAAVIAVGTLCLVDLLLTFGVIRRLREQTALLAAPDSRERAVIGVPEGELPGGFSATTTTGEVVSGTAGVRVVAFFASGCAACPYAARACRVVQPRGASAGRGAASHGGFESYGTAGPVTNGVPRGEGSADRGSAAAHCPASATAVPHVRQAF